jgi:hypothetical protein
MRSRCVALASDPLAHEWNLAASADSPAIAIKAVIESPSSMDSTTAITIAYLIDVFLPWAKTANMSTLKELFQPALFMTASAAIADV